MELLDIGVSLGRLHEKQDQQTSLIEEVRDDQREIKNRLVALESEKAFYRWLKAIIVLAFGFLSGQKWH
jgi:hypothetical protein